MITNPNSGIRCLLAYFVESKPQIVLMNATLESFTKFKFTTYESSVSTFEFFESRYCRSYSRPLQSVAYRYSLLLHADGHLWSDFFMILS